MMVREVDTPAPVRVSSDGLNFLINVRLKKINQDPIRPDHNFNSDQDHSEKFSIKAWLIQIRFSIRVMIAIEIFQLRSD